MGLIKFLSICVCFETLSSRCPGQGVPDTEGKPVSVNVKEIFGFSYLSEGSCLFPIPTVSQGWEVVPAPSKELDPLASGLTETMGF